MIFIHENDAPEKTVKNHFIDNETKESNAMPMPKKATKILILRIVT